MATDNFDNNENGGREESFDTTGLLLSYLSNWKWFVLSVVVCLILAYFKIATTVPLYQVEASIYLNVENEGNANPFNLTSAEAMVRMKDYIDETELEVMKSKNNVIKIVDSLDLAYSYYKKGRLRNMPLYEDNAVIARMDSASLHALKNPIFITVKLGDDSLHFNIKAKTEFLGAKEEKEFDNVTLPFDIDLSHGTVTLSRSTAIPELDGTEIINIVSPQSAAAALSSSLNIEFAKNSYKIVRIAYIGDNIKRGDDVIKALIDFYNRDIIEDKNRSAVQTEAFIIDRLVMISDELRDVENRLKDYRQAHNITDIQVQSHLNLSQVNNYETKKAELEAQLATYNEIESIVSSSDTYDMLPAAVQNSNIATSVEAYNRKVSQFNRTSEGLTADNPLVRNMREELSRDKVRIKQNLAAAKKALVSQIRSLSTLENRSAGELASTPTVDKGLQEIFREQQVKVNIYTFLLQRREEIAMQKTLATNSARLIDDPSGWGPVSPRRMMIFGIAFLLGLAIPALVIFLRRIIFPVFSDQDELERLTDVPILGEVCQTEKGQEEEIVVGEKVSTPVAELFRLLRNNISFTRAGADSKVILVTSAVSGEGKTFIATNLAMTYALMGKRVLVIGMDLRRPMLAHRFGFTNQRGVTTYLSGQASDIDSLILPSKVNENLFVLPAGPVPPNPNELLMSDNMTKMMEHLRNEFDYVIIDSAPIGVISDSYLILRYSDLQLYVTRAAYSTRSSLKVLHSAVATGKMPAAYVVINGVNITSNSYLYRRYGEYGHYGKHGQAYGYGYTSHNK